MSSYTNIERSIARALTRYPFLKRIAKSVFSRMVFLKNKKSYRFKSISQPQAISIGDNSSFFGYYDKSPENIEGLVLACVTELNTSTLPCGNNAVNLVVLNSSNEILVKLEINSYNWQQGCRAHWLDSDRFIYNDFDELDQRYICRVFSLKEAKEVKKFRFPVQDSFIDSYFISLNYQRLLTLRPDYGYRNLPNLKNAQLNDLENDGLWKVNYETGDVEFFISLIDVCNIGYTDDMHGAQHKFNHVMISPNGDKFIFMHRYLKDGMRVDRLLLADALNGELKLLSDYGMVSHCFWIDNRTVLGYMRGPSSIDAYWLLDIDSGKFSPLPSNGLERFGDGHPHVMGDWFITDSYPDKSRMQHLILCNWKTGEIKKIGEFFHGFEFSGECRCDLHPRLSNDGKTAYFDSVFTGRRNLYRIEL